MRTTIATAGCTAALLCMTLWAPGAQAYPAYDDESGGPNPGCVKCHPGFQGGTSAPLHNQHVNGFELTPPPRCNHCHPSGGGSTPVLTYDSGAFPGFDGPEGGLGCAGCHGRVYGEMSDAGEAKSSGWGLRQHHQNLFDIDGGITYPGTDSCQNCHGSAVTPLGENVPPPYYGLASNNLSDPCSSAQEDMPFDTDDVGLDNDGDGYVDYQADDDCDPSTTTTTTLPPGSGDVGITGKKLVIVDKLTAAGKAKIAYVAKDTQAGKGTTNEPLLISATLEYQSPTIGASGSAAMPQGAGWLVNKETVAKYVNKDAPTGGAVKVAVIKPQKLLKAVLKDLGDSGTAIDVCRATGPNTCDPNPGAVDVRTQFTVTDGATVRRHCGEFTGCARKVIGGGSGAKVVCKTATAGSLVTCPGSPSGAFLD